MAYWEQTLTADEQIRLGNLDRIKVFLSPRVKLPWYVTPNYDNLPNEVLVSLAERLPTLPPGSANDQKAYLINWYKSLSDEMKNFITFRWERVEDEEYEALYFTMKAGEQLVRAMKSAEKKARQDKAFKERRQDEKPS